MSIFYGKWMGYYSQTLEFPNGAGVTRDMSERKTEVRK